MWTSGPRWELFQKTNIYLWTSGPRWEPILNVFYGQAVGIENYLKAFLIEMKSQMKMEYLLLDKRSTLKIISKEYLSENGKWNENEIITCEKGERFKKLMCSQAVRLEKYLKKHIYLWTSGSRCKHLNTYSWGKRSEMGACG